MGVKYCSKCGELVPEVSDVHSKCIKCWAEDYKRSQRCSGRTTRIVDALVQELFTNGRIIVKDHHPSPEAHRHIMGVIERRLKSEHPGLLYEDLKFTSRYEIRIKDFNKNG